MREHQRDGFSKTTCSSKPSTLSRSCHAAWQRDPHVCWLCRLRTLVLVFFPPERKGIQFLGFLLKAAAFLKWPEGVCGAHAGPCSSLFWGGLRRRFTDKIPLETILHLVCVVPSLLTCRSTGVFMGILVFKSSCATVGSWTMIKPLWLCHSSYITCSIWMTFFVWRRHFKLCNTLQLGNYCSYWQCINKRLMGQHTVGLQKRLCTSHTLVKRFTLLDTIKMVQNHP